MGAKRASSGLKYYGGCGFGRGSGPVGRGPDVLNFRSSRENNLAFGENRSSLGAELAMTARLDGSGRQAAVADTICPGALRVRLVSARAALRAAARS